MLPCEQAQQVEVRTPDGALLGHVPVPHGEALIVGRHRAFEIDTPDGTETLPLEVAKFCWFYPSEGDFLTRGGFFASPEQLPRLRRIVGWQERTEE